MLHRIEELLEFLNLRIFVERTSVNCPGISIEMNRRMVVSLRSFLLINRVLLLQNRKIGK